LTKFAVIMLLLLLLYYYYNNNYNIIIMSKISDITDKFSFNYR